MAGTSYQMLEVLAFCNLERANPPSMTITVQTFLVKKKYNEEFLGVFILRRHEQTLNQISCSHSFLSSNLKVSNDNDNENDNDNDNDNNTMIIVNIVFHSTERKDVSSNIYKVCDVCYYRPGPNAPLEWMKDCVLTLSPEKGKQRSKILLGLNFYGQDFASGGGGRM